MPHTIKTVSPLPNYELQVHFRCGITKKYDMKPMMDAIQVYRYFLEDQNLFKMATVHSDGQSVFWNEYTDIGCEELWMNGKAAKSVFDSLLSCADAAALWGIDESTLRKAVAEGRLRNGIDIMKFGKQWVISLKSMEKHFGSLDKILSNRLTGEKMF